LRMRGDPGAEQHTGRDRLVASHPGGDGAVLPIEHDPVVQQARAAW
jgi:hypothetical protein